jgi:hypothetical protein
MLHVARVGDDFKGKATLFDRQVEFKFSSISQLAEQLNQFISDHNEISPEPAVNSAEKRTGV